MPTLVKKSTSPHSLIEHIKFHSRFLMIMSECVVSNTTQSVTQYTINDETYKSTYHWRISSPFKFWLSASDSQCHSVVLLLRYTPPAASQTTHCHGYGYCWLWRYKSGRVVVICHVACIVLCRPKHSVDVDAHGEMVWGVRGPSVWTVLLDIRLYQRWMNTYRDDGLL